jgi:orotate phosphoribosyltransferase
MTQYDISGGILEALPCRHGHFLLESGYHSDLWFSLDALFLDPHVLAPHVAALASLVRPYGVSAICGPLLGGAAGATHVAVGRTAFDLWAPTDCPHCLAGVPLEDPASRS